MKSSWFSKAISFLFHLMFLIVPLLFTSINEELFEFNKILAVYAFALLIGTCWIGESIVRQKLIWKRTPLDLPIAIFFLSQLLSTLFSINVHTSIFGYYSRFNGGLLSIISYIFLYYMFVNFVDIKRLKSLLSSLLIGGVLSALYALPEHFGHSPSCLLFTGKFDVNCWVQDVKNRVFGTFGQPNWLAAYLGMLLPLAIVNTKHVETQIKLMEDEKLKQFFQSLVRLGIAVLFIAVLFFTGSRSGIIALSIGLVMLAAAIVLLYSQIKHAALKQYGLMLVLTTFSIVVMIFLIPNPIGDKLGSVLKRLSPAQVSSSVQSGSQAPAVQAVGGTQLEVGGSESGQIRNVVWKGALRVWQRYPIFGSGVETFAYSYYKDRLPEHNLLSEWDFLYNKAHNEFLNFVSTTGTFGFLAYVVMIISFILFPLYAARKIFVTREKNWKLHAEVIFHHLFILLSLSAGIIIVSISNFFGFSTVMVSLLTFIFPAMSVVIVLNYAGHDREQTREQIKEEEIISDLSPAQWGALFCIGAVAFFFLLYVRKLWLADVSFAKGKQLNSFGQTEAAYPKLREATQMVPEEPTFHDEYSYNLSLLAVGFAQQSDATKAAEFASEAMKESDTTITLNRVHTNFWKTRVKVFLTLAQLDARFYAKAEEALLRAQELSPTDAKISYYLALLAQASNNKKQFLAYLLKTIQLKSNMEDARIKLAQYYEDGKETTKALEQYEYVIKFINPGSQTAKDRIASLSARTK